MKVTYLQTIDRSNHRNGDDRECRLSSRDLDDQPDQLYVQMSTTTNQQARKTYVDDGSR